MLESEWIINFWQQIHRASHTQLLEFPNQHFHGSLVCQKETEGFSLIESRYKVIPRIGGFIVYPEGKPTEVK
jgi:hypothetical protein